MCAFEYGNVISVVLSYTKHSTNVPQKGWVPIQWGGKHAIIIRYLHTSVYIYIYTEYIYIYVYVSWGVKVRAGISTLWLPQFCISQLQLCNYIHIYIYTNYKCSLAVKGTFYGIHIYIYALWSLPLFNTHAYNVRSSFLSEN